MSYRSSETECRSGDKKTGYQYSSQQQAADSETIGHNSGPDFNNNSNISDQQHQLVATNPSSPSSSSSPAIKVTRVVKSTYQIELRAETTDGKRIIDRFTTTSGRSSSSLSNSVMSRSVRSSRGSKNTTTNGPAVDYADVDRHLLAVDDDNMSIASSASSASADRILKWQQKSLYKVASKTIPSSPPAPHTPETAIFTRQQCRDCRQDPNAPCPLHDQVNPSKRTKSSHGTSPVARGLNHHEEEEETDEDVFEKDAVFVPAIVSSRATPKSKAGSVARSPPAQQAAAIHRSNSSAGQSVSSRGKKKVPLAMLSEDDDDDEEPDVRKTVRRHHETIFRTTNTRRLKPGEDPESSFTTDDHLSTSLVTRLGQRMISSIASCRSYQVLLLILIMILICCAFWISSHGLPINLFNIQSESEDRILPMAAIAMGDFVQKDVFNQLAERNRQLEKECQQLKQELQKLKDDQIILMERQSQFSTRVDSEFSYVKSSCCRPDDYFKSLVSPLLVSNTAELMDKFGKLETELESKISEATRVTRSVPSYGGPVGDDDFDARVRRLIWLHDADKIGLVDYALESAGATVISTRCSKTYKPKNQNIGVFGIPFFSTSKSPRTVIQPNVDPGNCWAFEGHEGYLLIKLSRRIVPTNFTYEHCQQRIIPGNDVSSAPKHFTVMGLNDEYSIDGDVLGRYEFLDNGISMQTFDVGEANVSVYEYIELRINDNHGNSEYTCLYRFRVHGYEPMRP